VDGGKPLVFQHRFKDQVDRVVQDICTEYFLHDPEQTMVFPDHPKKGKVKDLIMRGL